ncbi:hypothetical protein [Nonomuraea sp. NPDC049129]|uniref:hypothetical protein n=1 Tax=Nonomuraea sp. NPDC049129 TaxID=3155272 RepID=UPI0033C4F3DB
MLDLLITSNLLARAERAGKAEQLRTFPKLRKAARTMASAVEVLMSAPEATEDRLVSLVEVWKAIEEVVPREKLASAVQTIAAFVPATDDDAAAEWRAELVKRYRTVQGFSELLLEVIRFRAVEAGTPVLAMVRTAAAMAKNRRRYTPGDIAAHEALIAGSWRPLVYRNPDLPEGQIGKAAFVLCAVMHLHHALRRRDVFAEGAERWSDPRARLLDGSAWQEARAAPPHLAGAGGRTGRASGRARQRAGGRLCPSAGRARRQHRGAVRRRPAAVGEARRGRRAAADEGAAEPGRRHAAPAGLSRAAAGSFSTAPACRPTSPTSPAPTRPWRTSGSAWPR